MRRITGFGAVLGTAVAIGLVTSLAQGARAADDSSQAAYRDIEQTIGMVPAFFKAFPESGIAGAWAEFKSVQLSSKTSLNVKTKELIGLAVSAQIPCQYCVYFHTAVAKANGATDEEIREVTRPPYSCRFRSAEAATAHSEHRRTPWTQRPMP